MIIITSDVYGQANTWPDFRGGMIGVPMSSGGALPNGIIYCEPPVSDTAPMICYFQGADSWPEATGGNQRGGSISECPGIGTRQITIDNFALCAGDNVNVIVDGANCILTEGVQWNRGASNNEAAISLANAIPAFCTGITNTYETGGSSIYILPDIRACTINLTESDATCTTLVQGLDGSVLLGDGSQNRPAIGFAADDDGTGTGIFRLNINSLSITTDGAPRSNWSSTGLYMYSPINLGAQRIYSTAGPAYIGTIGATGHGLGSGDALFGGKLEVDGTTYLDGPTYLAGANYVPDNNGIYFGTGADTEILFSIVQTPDSTLIAVGVESNALSLVEYADRATDFAFPQQTDPTLVIQSANQAQVTQRIWFAHNQTDGVIQTGFGDIHFTPAGGDVQVNGAFVATGDLAGSEVFTVGCYHGTTMGASELCCPANGEWIMTNESNDDFTRLSLGSNTNAFPAIGRVGTSVSFGLGDGTNGGSQILNRIIAAVPVEPHACDATHVGAQVYVDDSNDSNWGRVCICSYLDGTGYDWRDDGNIVSAACPFF